MHDLARRLLLGASAALSLGTLVSSALRAQEEDGPTDLFEVDTRMSFPSQKWVDREPDSGRSLPFRHQEVRSHAHEPIVIPLGAGWRSRKSPLLKSTQIAKEWPGPAGLLSASRVGPACIEVQT